jgi:hypothetical protein
MLRLSYPTFVSRRARDRVWHFRRLVFLIPLLWITLIDSASAMNRRIFDCGEPFSDVVCALNRFSSQYMYTFGRGEGANVRGPNPLGPPYAGSTDVDTLYDASLAIHQYYLTKFGRDGANGVGGTGTGSSATFLTSYTVVLANANGSSVAQTQGKCAGGDGAYAFTSPGYVAFCAGTTNDDIVGHEYGHLVTGRYLDDDITDEDLPSGEAGALAESMADLFGEGFERYRTGTTDWLLTIGTTNRVIRNLADPPSVPQAGRASPDRYLSPDFHTGSEDNGGVHFNAGVLNKAAYLAVEGGTFNGFSITGIGFNKVEQIWYRALTTYMEPGETFNQAYDDIILAAADLYGPADVWEVTKALRSVEMHLSREGLRGDFNKDGFVDAADWVMVQKQLGTYYTLGALQDWRIHFGNSLAGSGQDTNVPEPAAWALVFVAALCSGVGRKARR